MLPGMHQGDVASKTFMCVDSGKYLTLLSPSVLICQMGTTIPRFVGLLEGLDSPCSKAQRSLKTDS